MTDFRGADMLAAESRDRLTAKNSELSTLTDSKADLLGALKLLLENCYVPDRNCSCHVSPPCSDCVDNGALREAMEIASAAIAKAEGRA